MPTITIEPGRMVEDNNASSSALQLVVSLDETATATTTVDFRTIMGTATDRADFDQIDLGTLTFVPGDDFKVINVPTPAGGAPEPDEFLTVELFNPRGAEFEGGAMAIQAAGWINDDSGGVAVGMHVTNPVVVEGNSGQRFAEFTVSLSRPIAADTSFAIETRDGSATAGEDYEALPVDATVEFFANQTEAVVAVPLFGDALSEPSEFFHLVVTPDASIATHGPGTVGTATILDDDAPGNLPVISVEAAATSEASNANDLNFAVRLSRPATSQVTVPFLVTGGTASGDEFGTPRPASEVVFMPGETTKMVEVHVNIDSTSEPDETVILELLQPTNAIFDGQVPRLRTTGFIVEDGDNPGTTRVVAITAPIVEERLVDGVNEAVFQISLSQPHDEELTFSYTTRGQTATDGEDFVGQLGDIVLAPGQTRAAVRVPILDDLSREGIERFDLRILPLEPDAFAPVTQNGITATARIQDGTLVGTNSSNRIDGTPLRDLIFGEGGDDLIFGLGAADILRGGNGRDRINGGSGADRVRGDNGNDRLNGNAGNDVLNGGAGRDRIVGGSGEDSITGSRGRDVLSGGGDADTFIYRSHRDSLPGDRQRDLIRGFDRREDVIDLSAIDANIRRNNDQDFEFIARKGFSGTAGELRFGAGVLAADRDGDGRSDFEIGVEGVTRLNEGDFVL